MDLFVINRYTGTEDDVDIVDQETQHLQNFKQKIEERKKAHASQKKSDVITLRVPEKLIDNEKNLTEKNIVEADQKLEDLPKPERRSKDKPTSEFKVLGAQDFEKKTKAPRLLPYWLSHADGVSTSLQNLSCSVEHLPWLHDTLKSSLLTEGVTQLFPVQEKVIPYILEEHKIPHPLWPHDVCVSAPTGSGKTLAFVLPIIQILMNDVGRHIRALVVLPVQELAAQVAKVFKKYAAKTGLNVALLSGSTPLQHEQHQIVRYTESAGWISQVDVIVCTAGRLVEHIQNTEGFSLKHLKFLVIDEADRIMDHIQNDWLYHMDRHIKLENELMTGKVPNLSWNSLISQKAPPHKLLFSATLSQDPEKLEQWGLFQPRLFSAAAINEYEDEDNIRKYTTPAELEEQFVSCTPEEKPLILYHFLVEQKWDKVLCFTNAAQSAHRLAVLLNVWGRGKLKVADLSGSLDRTTREAVLRKFTQSEINVLIGTDALARGIDIPDCNFVISYDPPKNIKTYIHRVGRTGRAGRKGRAVTIIVQNQIPLFKELIRSGGKNELPQLKIDSSVSERLLNGYQAAMQETKTQIHTEINTKVQKSIDLKRGFRSKPQKRKHNQTSPGNNF
ncbi:hypothetical protein O0L34_g9560 [Tuta absoluta]|nr:hypothetical protein O0L34_g9560 [Tuta absoluta]